MTFQQKLDAIVAKNNSLVCIGLDSEFGKLPERVRTGPKPQATFNKAIIYATQDIVCAYKLNTAFYEARGSAGVDELKNTCDFLREHYPDAVIIIDAKRADIGNTNTGYCEFVFGYLGADAVTVHPYLGSEAVKPFTEYRDRGIFVLCKTSNPGAGEFQDLTVNDLSVTGASDGGQRPLYQLVAERVSKFWNYNTNCGLVVGATYPAELQTVRSLVGDMPILIPGIGAQGGDLEATVKAGVDSKGNNAIIAASRSIIFASDALDYAQKARAEAMKLKESINSFRRV